MQLLKAIKVTLAQNINAKGKLKDESLVGQAVMGWPQFEQVKDETIEGGIRVVPQIMYVVVWENRVLTPASSVYKNEELAQLGLAEEFEYLEDEDDDTEDTDDTEDDWENQPSI